MEDETDWAAKGVFSPSKARIAQLHAKDWALVDAWLAKKYAPSHVPSFERNEDTLPVLLALVASNDAADEQRNATQRVQRAALNYLQRQQGDESTQLLQELIEGLDKDSVARLQSLAELSVCLDAPVKDGTGQMLAAIIHLQTELFETKQRETDMARQTDALQDEHKRLAILNEYLKTEQFQTSSEKGEQTSEWLKGSKHLRAKIAEYDERIAASRPSPQMQSMLDDLDRTSTGLREAKARLAVLQDQVEVLQRISNGKSDVENLISATRARLLSLREERDQLLAGSNVT